MHLARVRHGQVRGYQVPGVLRVVHIRRAAFVIPAGAATVHPALRSRVRHHRSLHGGTCAHVWHRGVRRPRRRRG